MMNDLFYLISMKFLNLTAHNNPQVHHQLKACVPSSNNLQAERKLWLLLMLVIRGPMVYVCLIDKKRGEALVNKAFDKW